MKYITKREIDRMILNLLTQNFSLKTRMELEQYFGESYTKAQIERIWYRYQYIKSGGGKSGRKDRKQNQGFAESDDRAGNRCISDRVK